MGAAVYDSQTPEEFEQLWDWMLEAYDLGDHKWLPDLYEEREMWVPCYLKIIFGEGMSSTQRSEGVNVFFDGYINVRITLKQFVEQFELALRDKVEKEKEADAVTSLKSIPIVTEYPMEKQVRNLYTNSKFKEFQVQLLKMMYCNFNKIEVTPDGKVYNVQQDVWIEDNYYNKMIFFITYNSEDCDIHCTCQMFAFRGIQCCHVLSVLSNNGVKELPDKYILRRWRKDVKRCHTKVKVGFSCWKNDDASTEYYDLYNKFTELADWVACNNQYRGVDDCLGCKNKEVQQTFIKQKKERETQRKSTRGKYVGSGKWRC
ncbi:hypothetical protein MKW98_014337 [Papaver atlanticum]|uniref:Protein FAR1-RELATED SEQUENCE n=1 Tax=Papaver atlanticum TaxID=357466 RepID=A0AAD4SR55_9MAGN|nr:hypothetical protein MKW98_014337 [Papaver atlanticum]